MQTTANRAARMAAALLILSFLATMDLCRNASAQGNTVTNTAHEYSGQATVMFFTNLHKGPPVILIGDTGPLPSTGGTIDVSVDATNMVGLSLDLGSASTRGVDDAASSTVSLNNLSLRIETTNGARHTIVADTIMLDVAATCTATGPVLTAHSQITGLTVDGVLVDVTGQPNQLINLGDLGLIINEQFLSTTDTTAAITLAAIHIIDPGSLDGPVGLVHADITCNTITPPPPPTTNCDDFVTGCGWIAGTNNCRANFALSAGIRKNIVCGYLCFVDQASGMCVKSTRATGYEISDALTRTINFNVNIDGAPGMAIVRVVDNGESGSDDVFQISLSNGYVASGTLGSEGVGGGNIRIHLGKCRDGGDDDCIHHCGRCSHTCHHHGHRPGRCNHSCDGADHKCHGDKEDDDHHDGDRGGDHHDRDGDNDHQGDKNDCEHHCQKCKHKCHRHDHNPSKCNHLCDRKDHQCPGDLKCEHKCDRCNHKCEKHDHKPDKCNHKCDRQDHKCPADYTCEHKCPKCNHKCEKHDHKSDKCSHQCDGQDHKCPPQNNGGDSSKPAIANGENKAKGKNR